MSYWEIHYKELWQKEKSVFEFLSVSHEFKLGLNETELPVSLHNPFPFLFWKADMFSKSVWNETCLILSGLSARYRRATVHGLSQRWLTGSCLLSKAFVLVHVAQFTMPYGKQWHKWAIQTEGRSRLSPVSWILQFCQCPAKSSAPHAHSCGFTAVSEWHTKFISSCAVKAANHDKWKRRMFTMAQGLFGQVACSRQLACCTQMLKLLIIPFYQKSSRFITELCWE